MSYDHTPQPDHPIDLLSALPGAVPARRFSLGGLITFGFAWMFGLEPFLAEPGGLSSLRADAGRSIDPKI